jgi:hypothetical protein
MEILSSPKFVRAQHWNDTVTWLSSMNWEEQFWSLYDNMHIRPLGWRKLRKIQKPLSRKAGPESHQGHLDCEAVTQMSGYSPVLT